MTFDQGAPIISPDARDRNMKTPRGPPAGNDSATRSRKGAIHDGGGTAKYISPIRERFPPGIPPGSGTTPSDPPQIGRKDLDSLRISTGELTAQYDGKRSVGRKSRSPQNKRRATCRTGSPDVCSKKSTPINISSRPSSSTSDPNITRSEELRGDNRLKARRSRSRRILPGDSRSTFRRRARSS